MRIISKRLVIVFTLTCDEIEVSLYPAFHGDLEDAPGSVPIIYDSIEDIETDIDLMEHMGLISEEPFWKDIFLNGGDLETVSDKPSTLLFKDLIVKSAFAFAPIGEKIIDSFKVNKKDLWQVGMLEKRFIADNLNFYGIVTMHTFMKLEALKHIRMYLNNMNAKSIEEIEELMGS